MGIIATAGAIAGAGQGITEAGQQAQKLDLMKKMNELQQSREEAIERLRGGEQEKILGKQQGFEQEQTERKIGAASAAAGRQMKFEEEQNTQNRAAAQKRSETSAAARVGAAKVTAESRVTAKGAPKIWEPVKLNQGGFDPTSHLPTNNQLQISYNHFTGRSYAQVGDKFIPWDASTNKPATDPKAIKRAPVEDLQDLMQDPLGVIPAGGPNAGLTKAEVFEAAHNYLPASWTSRANAAAAKNPTQYSTLFSEPYAATKGGSNPDEGAADNASQAGEDSENNAQPFQSSAMQSYSANAQ